MDPIEKVIKKIKELPWLYSWVHLPTLHLVLELLRDLAKE